MTIPFKTGIPSLLKEKGFDTPTNGFFHVGANQVFEYGTPRNYNSIRAHVTHTSAPDYDQVLDWLEEKRGVKLWASFDEPIDLWYFSTSNGYISFSEFDTRYEALNAGILEALKLIK